MRPDQVVSTVYFPLWYERQATCQGLYKYQVELSPWPGDPAQLNIPSEVAFSSGCGWGVREGALRGQGRS